MEIGCTVSFNNFKSQNFKLSVSNPKNKYVAYVSVLSPISNCQGLGRKNKHQILKTDRSLVIRTPWCWKPRFWERGGSLSDLKSGGCRCALVGVPWRGSVSARLAWGDIISQFQHVVKSAENAEHSETHLRGHTYNCHIKGQGRYKYGQFSN